MVVWWGHGIDLPAEVRQRLFAQLAVAGDERFGPGGWYRDEAMNQIPDHFHAHARDPEWRERRFRRPSSIYGGVGGERRVRGQ